MNPKKALILATILFSDLSQVFAGTKTNEIFLSYEQAKKKWGEESLNFELFKQAPMSKRGKYAAAILRNQKQWQGKSKREIVEALGKTSGHYWSERFPTFILETGLGALQLNTWQLVFFVDSSEKVTAVKVQLNCCSLEIWEKRGVKPPPTN